MDTDRAAAPPPPRRVRLAHFEIAPGHALDEPVRLAWVDAVEDLVVRIAEAGGLGPDASGNFGVAVREAVMNALRHGAGPARGSVAVSFRMADGPALVVTVRDRGAGFDPDSLPDPCAPGNLARSCGRGVFYMRRFSDEVSFSFPQRGGTVTRLSKHLGGSRLFSASPPEKVGKRLRPS